jgi:hypothetical protein
MFYLRLIRLPFSMAQNPLAAISDATGRNVDV